MATAEEARVYQLIELTGTSSTSLEDALTTAIKRAHRTINLGFTVK